MIEDLIYALKTKFGFGLKSRNWKHWFAYLDLKTCEECRKMHGKIYAANEKIRKKPPRHMYCRCEIMPMNAVISGECSPEGKNGADWWLMNMNTLPNYYIYIADLVEQGWVGFVTYDHYQTFMEVVGG